MLDLLETRLGLKIRHVSRAQRILQFRNLLEAVAASRETFYRRSFENDPLATATTLLQWRDNLIEAGWDGVASGSDSQRLQDLAAVEAHTAGKLGPGTGDRLAAILKELDSRQTQIESLTVLDPPEHLPTVWKRLCDKLGARYQSIDSVFRTALFDTSTDLGAIQTLLKKPNNGAARKLILHKDGSLLCLTAHSEVTLAQAIAQWLRALRRDSRTTLVARHDAGILDRALAALDEPTLGLQPRSVVRPIPQVLLLAFLTKRRGEQRVA